MSQQRLAVTVLRPRSAAERHHIVRCRSSHRPASSRQFGLDHKATPSPGRQQHPAPPLKPTGLCDDGLPNSGPSYRHIIALHMGVAFGDVDC
jgi:hypothetical protein